STHGNLAENEPTNAGASLAAGRTVNLGNAWIKNPTEDLAFQYTAGGQPQTGLVFYTGAALTAGDLNADGVINAADWVIERSNLHGNLSSLSLAEAYRAGDLNGDKQNNHDDFVAFKTLYETANGVGSFAALVGVPEPASLVLIASAGMFA